MPWIQRAKTMRRYDVSRRTIERWEEAGRRIREAATTEDEAAVAFPESSIRNGRRYDDNVKLDSGDVACARVGRSTTRTPPNAGVGRRPPSANDPAPCEGQRASARWETPVIAGAQRPGIMSSA
jgi:hypothetical protein